MKIEITATDQIIELDGVPVRRWTGTTERGIRCEVFVHRLTVHRDEDATQFEAELKERMPPTNFASVEKRLP